MHFLLMEQKKNEERNKFQIQEPWTKTVFKKAAIIFNGQKNPRSFWIEMQNFTQVNINIWFLKEKYVL